MPVFRQPQGILFTEDNPVEMHFHDEDETWVVQEGRCRARMVDREGKETLFDLEAGDIWMVEAGVMHGCKPGKGGCRIFPFLGTIPEGSHEPGHYYMHKEGYMPTLVLEKTPIDRAEEREDY